MLLNLNVFTSDGSSILKSIGYIGIENHNPMLILLCESKERNYFNSFFHNEINDVVSAVALLIDQGYRYFFLVNPD